MSIDIDIKQIGLTNKPNTRTACMCVCQCRVCFCGDMAYNFGIYRIQSPSKIYSQHNVNIVPGIWYVAGCLAFVTSDV